MSPAWARLELDVFDGALLVLVIVIGVDRGLGHDRVAADGADQLLAYRRLALFGEEAAFGQAGLTDDLVEAHAVELAGHSAEGLDLP